MKRVLPALAVWLAIAPAIAGDPGNGDDAPPPAAASPAPSKFRSPEDGALDVSGFLDEPYGFLPILVPITEPAVGYGAAAGVVFIDRPPGEPRIGLDRPNLTAVGGLATENGTRGLFAGDLRHWSDNRIQTLVGGVYASVNLDFYGAGGSSTLEDHPLTYTLEPLGGGARARVRFGDSHLWGGLSYALVDTKITFDDDAAAAGLLGSSSNSRAGGMTPSIAYDSRDSLFTPARGTYFEGSAGFFSPTLGGDDTFQRVTLTWIGYTPLHARVTLGVRGSATFAFGEVPFYLLPYIGLRGAPVLRYQGEEVAEVEAEVRWQFWKRWSVVGFTGYGAAWNDFERVEDKRDIVTGGTGFRYELARRYGMHAGLDVAFGPDDTAVYIQVGSAWFRP